MISVGEVTSEHWSPKVYPLNIQILDSLAEKETSFDRAVKNAEFSLSLLEDLTPLKIMKVSSIGTR